MRRYRFSIRRNLFEQGISGRHKDFNEFHKMYTARKRWETSSRIILVLIGTLTILGIILYSVYIN